MAVAGIILLCRVILRWRSLNKYPWLTTFSYTSGRTDVYFPTSGEYALVTIGHKIIQAGPPVVISDLSGNRTEVRLTQFPFSFKFKANICHEYAYFTINKSGEYIVNVRRISTMKERPTPAFLSMFYRSSQSDDAELGIRRKVQISALVLNAVLLIVGLALLQIGTFMFLGMFG